jgi:hypothetical protein
MNFTRHSHDDHTLVLLHSRLLAYFFRPLGAQAWHRIAMQASQLPGDQHR